MKTLHLLAATVAVGAVAAPAAAQQPYPQTYPVQSYPQQTYPAQPYGYPGQTTGTNVVEQIINQLLGNNSSYTFSDRTQVSRCATAALAQAGRQFGRYGYGSPYGQAYGGQQYSQPYGSQYDYANGYGQMRVTAITDVQRRSRGGLRIQGLISSGAYAQPATATATATATAANTRAIRARSIRIGATPTRATRTPPTSRSAAMLIIAGPSAAFG